jgi:hypothetical protein
VIDLAPDHIRQLKRRATWLERRIESKQLSGNPTNCEMRELGALYAVLAQVNGADRVRS